MRPHLFFTLTALMTLAVAPAGDGFAQTKARTETIRPPQTPAPPSPLSRAAAAVTKTTPLAVDVITDLSQLPAPVARMRERILAAARSGSLERLLGVMQS